MLFSHPLHAIEHLALDLYIEWLNSFKETDPTVGWTYTREDFFAKGDAAWEETYHIASDTIGHYTHYTMSAGTGDDGGPAILHVWGWMEEEGEAYKAHVAYILQEFDTMFSLVYNKEA